MRISKEWWIYNGKDIIPSSSAPKWLIDEYNRYKDTCDKMDSDDYIVDDRPRPKHPIIDRLTDEEIDELCLLIEINK